MLLLIKLKQTHHLHSQRGRTKDKDKTTKTSKSPEEQGTLQEANPTASSPCSAKGCTPARFHTCRSEGTHMLNEIQKCGHFTTWGSGRARKNASSNDRDKLCASGNTQTSVWADQDPFHEEFEERAYHGTSSMTSCLLKTFIALARVLDGIGSPCGV